MTTESTRHTSGGMQTRLVNTAADVISRAMQQGRTLPAALAVALDSAQLLQSPSNVAELDRLRSMYDTANGRTNDLIDERDSLLNRVAELEADRDANDREYEQATARIAALEKAAVEGRAALAAFCADHEDPGTAALGALYLLQQATSGTPMQPGETVPKVYRASHDAIVMGLYLTTAAARAHCEAEERRAETSESTLDWIEDEEDGVAELVAGTNLGEEDTGYLVTALEIAAEYDPEADQ